MEIDGDLQTEFAILHTINYHLQRIPYTGIDMVELDGVKVPQIFIEYEEELIEDTVNRSDLLRILGEFLTFMEKQATA